MAYVKTNWVDNTTPIDKNNLNKIESGIKNNDINIGEENYDNTKTYEVGDIVRYNEKIYKCITAITTAENFDISKWEQTNIVEIVQSEKSKIYELIEAISTPIVGEGENITLNDTAEKRFENFDIEGNSEQETREGYNLLPPSKQYTYTNGDVKLASDGIGKYTMNSDVTAQTEAIKYTFELEKEYTIKNNDYLHIMNEGTKSSNAALILIDNNDEGIILCDLSSNNRIENLSNYAGKTIKGIQLYMNPIKVDITLTPMIINNVSTAKNFEQYGASPSPDYPSEVESCGDNGSINEVISNKNLLPNEIEDQTINGITVKKDDDGGYIFNGTASAGTFFYMFSNQNLRIPAGTYIQSVHKSGTVSGNSYFEMRDINGDTISGSALNIYNTESNSITLTEDVYVKQSTIYFGQGRVLNNFKIYPMLESGSTATDYVPHEEQDYSIPVQQPMRAIGDIRDKFIKKNNKWYERHYIRYLELLISAMNNSEEYPGWTNVKQIKNDFPNVNSRLITKISFLCNIFEKSSRNIVINTLGNNSILYLDKSLLNLTQTQWKENYPNLVLKLVYISPEPLDLPCTEEQSTILFDIEQNAKTYKGVTHIYSNDEVSPNFYVEAVKDLTTLIQ